MTARRPARVRRGVDAPANVMVATPAYGGAVQLSYVRSLLGYAAAGLRFTLVGIANESLVTRARNALLSTFHARPEYTHLLFLDADLGQTAANAGPLIEPVATGAADMTIAAFANRVKLGGRGFVVRLSGTGIRRATGWSPAQPLNGQRCLTRAAFDAARPLAPGFGVETAMTIDLQRKGFRIVEVEVDMAHRATGGDLAAQLHRGRQFLDVARALATRVSC